MIVILKETQNNSFVAINKERNILHILDWSIKEKNPKDKEVWTVVSNMYSGLELIKPFKEECEKYNNTNKYAKKDFSIIQKEYEALIDW